VYTKDTGAIESPERQQASDSNSSTCPECNGPLSGIDTRGRGRNKAEPCGCSVSDAHWSDGQRVATDGGEPEDVALVRVTGRQENIDFEVQNGVLYLDFKDRDAIRSLVRFATAAAHGNSLRVEDVDEEDLSLDDLAPFFPFGSDEVADEEKEIVADGGVPYYELTGFKRDLLWTILKLQSEPETESYGLALKETLEEKYEGEVHHGRLYPNLDDLVEYGLVEKQALDRRTNEYRLTGAGRVLLEDVSGERDRVLDRAATPARADGGSQ
jgi:DNA-binding PadR family transcriptional regulator